MNDPLDCDVAVLGAGLAGLTAAITVAQAGHRVMIFERLSRAGGLCGTFELDGHSFIRACNEFGSGVERDLSELSVSVRFVPSRARLFVAGREIEMPVRLFDIPELAKHAPGFVSLARGWRTNKYDYLGQLLSAEVRDTWIHDLFGFVSSTSATPLSRIRLADMAALVRQRYGWHRPVKPIGGPEEVVRALVRRAEGLGVRLQLDAPASVARDGGGFVVDVPEGRMRAREIISSAPRWNEYPADSWPAASYGVVLMALDRDLEFPNGVSTVHFIPRGVMRWMDEARRGRLPEEFGFLLTKQLDPAPTTGRTVVGFFTAPLGRDEFTNEDKERIERYVRARAGEIIPGIADAIRYFRVISPADFQRLHGLSSAPFARLPPAGFEKPPVLDERTGIHHVGVSVGPPGAETGAAIRCGRLVGAEVARRLASRGNRRASG